MKHLLYLFFAPLFLISCDDFIQNHFEIGSPIEPRSIDLPIVVDGILKFDDLDNALDYYNYLDSIATNSPNPDSSLNIEEQRFSGFLSLRKATYVDSLNEIKFDDYFQKDYIADIVYKSILNANYEVGVDDSVYVHTGLNQNYKIKSWDIPTIEAFRNWEKGQSIPPVECYNAHVETLFNKDIQIKSEMDTIIISPRSFNVRINRDVGLPDACDPYNIPLTATFQYLNANGDWVPYVGDWTVRWGDGSSWLYNDLSTLQVSHPFLQGGTYEGELEVSYLDPNQNLQTFSSDINFVVYNVQCSAAEEIEYSRKEISNWRLVSRLWFKMSFGQVQGAESEAWRKNSNGNWKKRSTQLEVWCGSKWYNYCEYYGCEFDAFKQKSDSGNSRQELVFMRPNTDNCGYSYLDDLQSNQTKSTHRLEASGYVLTEELYLMRCD